MTGVRNVSLKNLHKRIVHNGEKISFASYSNHYFKVSALTIRMILSPSLYLRASWHPLILLWWIRVEYLATMLGWASDFFVFILSVSQAELRTLCTLCSHGVAKIHPYP